VQQTADRLARVDAERAALEDERRRRVVERDQLAERSRQHLAARRAYDHRRAELSQALRAAGRQERFSE
jgi:hypothetical protein